jgi:hypothetical protein
MMRREQLCRLSFAYGVVRYAQRTGWRPVEGLKVSFSCGFRRSPARQAAKAVACTLALALSAPASTAPLGVGAHPVRELQAPASNGVEVWHLRQGDALHTSLEQWARSSGWQLHWRVPVSWRVAADTSFQGDFPSVLSEVIEALFDEGKPVRLAIWPRNRYAEVQHRDAR